MGISRERHIQWMALGNTIFVVVGEDSIIIYRI